MSDQPRTLRHNGVGEADMETPEEYRRLMNPTTTTTMPLLTDHEDTTRYTAPPDEPNSPEAYNGFEILNYIQSCLPDGMSKRYTTEEIREHLQTAIAWINDPEVGILNNS